jgi:two-component system chemotaxis response regulator CheY
MNTVDNRLVRTFVSECAEHLAIMEKSLIALELNQAEADGEMVSRLLRAAHAVRTGAGLCGLTSIFRLAERTEHAMAPIGFDRVAPSPERVSVLLRAVDALGALLQDAETENEAESETIVAGIMDALATLGRGRDSAEPRREPDRRLRSLLVEDDFTSRLVLQTFLSRYGDCHVATNGREAVGAFRAALQQGQTYDLICMDIMMPEMDGREAARQIRAMEEVKGISSTDGAKIVMTTAVSDLKEVARSFQDLCDAYLVKPVDLAQLLGHMKTYNLVR